MGSPSACPSAGSVQEIPPTGQTSLVYMDKLSADCIGFSSSKGKQLFKEALQTGHMECYFKLAAQFLTQDPMLCGVTTLVMVLNSLEVDPKRVRIPGGRYKWYDENMLGSCVSLDRAAETGINMDEFAHIATCNMLDVNMVRATEDTSEEQFRTCVTRMTRHTDEVLVVSYSRKTLGQLGDGHFSPVGGYHEEQDLVLVLDIARYKHPPHWVPLPLLFKAMQGCDKDTGLPRGYLQLRRRDTVPEEEYWHV